MKVLLLDSSILIQSTLDITNTNVSKCSCKEHGLDTLPIADLSLYFNMRYPKLQISPNKFWGSENLL